MCLGQEMIRSISDLVIRFDDTRKKIGDRIWAMTELKKVGDLEINEDLGSQSHEWIFERIGWMFMGVIIILALLGLLGPGPLSNRAEKFQQVSVHYNRFVRHEAPAKLEFILTPAQPGEAISIWLSSDFIKGIELQSIDPEPARVINEGSRYVYVFQRGGSSSSFPLVFRYEPAEFGKLPLQFGMPGSPEYSLTQYAYP